MAPHSGAGHNNAYSKETTPFGGSGGSSSKTNRALFIVTTVLLPTILTLACVLEALWQWVDVGQQRPLKGSHLVVLIQMQPAACGQKCPHWSDQYHSYWDTAVFRCWCN